jgi:P27 family predicted phage terminase small subunit
MPDRVPNRLKVINGDKASRINIDEPAAREMTRLPVAPAWLTVSQNVLYKQVCRELMAMHLLYAADLDIVLHYVVDMDLANRLGAEINDMDSLVVESGTGLIHAHPYLAAVDRAQGRALAFAIQLGLTPRARATLRMAAVNPNTEAAHLSPEAYFAS